MATTTATRPERTTIDEAAIQDLGMRLRGALIRPGDPSYDDARKVYNAMIDKQPALIAQCADVADVIACVNFAREQRLLVAIRAGGHNGPGLGTVDDGLVIDLSPMNGIRVDPVAKTARVEGGAQAGRSASCHPGLRAGYSQRHHRHHRRRRHHPRRRAGPPHPPVRAGHRQPARSRRCPGRWLVRHRQ